MYSKKFLKNSTKLLRSPLPVMLQIFFTQRAFAGQSKGSCELDERSKGIRRVSGHPKGTGRALKGHLCIQGNEQSSTYAVETLEHSST